MEFLLAKVASAVMGNLVEIGTVGIFGWIFVFLMKRVDNDKIKIVIRTTFFGLGVASTLGLSKWKYTKGWWNKWGEPFLVDLINNTVVEAARAYIEGMRSDNDA